MTEVVQPAFNVTVDLALDIVRAAMDRAAELERPMSIAVVDAAGHLKAFARMDGSPLLGVSVAQAKAWSAIAWDMSTGAWHPFIKDDPVLLEGVPRIPGLSMLP